MQNKEQMRRARLREISEEIRRERQELLDCCSVRADGSVQSGILMRAEQLAALAERLDQTLQEELGDTGEASPGMTTEQAKQMPVTAPDGMTISKETTIGALKVLLLDDNELTREYHMSMLARLGVPCAYAANGADALHELKEAERSGADYDVCIVNWNMPGIEGILLAIRSVCADGGIVIAGTTGEPAQQEAQMYASGVDYVLGKPVYQAVLYRFLTEICKNLFAAAPE